MTFPTNASDFFVWLGSSSSGAFILSFLMERTTLFQKLSETAKTWISFATFLLLPTVAYFGQVGMGTESLPSEPHAIFRLVANLLVSGLFTWVVGELAHKADPVRA